MSSKIAIATSEKSFSSIEEAAKHYGLKSSLVKVRMSRGWSVDEAFNIIPRVPPVKHLEQESFVYGWWSVSRSRYVYVGLTTNTIKSRTASHWRDARLGKKGNFYDFLRASSRECVEVHELWRGAIRDVAAMEVLLIKEKSTLIASGGFNILPGGSLGGVGVGRQVDFNGIIFESVKSFARHLALPYGFVYSRLKAGMTPEEVSKESIKSREVSVNGVMYQNLVEACKAHGVPYARVSSRIGAGWSVEDAISKMEKFSGGATPVSKIKIFSVNGVSYSSLSAASRAHGVDPHLVKRRIGLGWTMERALSTDKFTRKGVKNKGVTC